VRRNLQEIDAPVPKRWFFRCASCGARITEVVVETSAPVERLDAVGRDNEPALPPGTVRTVAAGHTIAWLGLSPGGCLVNVQSLRDFQWTGDLSGCCGPTGYGGPNLGCVHGHTFGTGVADCFTPHFAHLSHVTRCAAEVHEQGTPLIFPAEGTCTSEWEFITWLHEVLAVADWFGADLPALVRSYQGPAVTLVWVGSDRSRQLGVPVHRLAAELTAPPIRLFLE
jgi:hypothetical protein